jgi:protein-ribulosamine 3-kinase
VSAWDTRQARAGFLEEELRRALGDRELRVRALEAVSGGCIHEAVRVRTTRGDWFAKWNDACAPDLFLGEAEGLRALRETGSGLAIPEVLLAGGPGDGHPAFIVMEYLAPSPRGDDEALGRGLASIHALPRETFGFPVTTYCGPTPQDNRTCPTWAEFYAERRLRPLVRRLADERGASADALRLLDRVIARLPELLAQLARPSLIHGDLWSGNVLATARGPGLVDPACAACDRELEFGITTLFGGFSERFFAAYHEALPLAHEWRERNALYQLYHLLNHQLIFGGHYEAEALAIARRLA